ncbi:hypothetical protein SAMN04490243_0579 [Robiginitalea myxolifaciens]|uniref:Uncharacterized protein n=1 Tax=Robiginitalea myxolifaciens TaxID=400055 RepID=A0A1I6FSI7_9FLAO|nr:fibronectin type III domain-containing protein [Robiginitalea myxolifaciens]SFR32922.1 hypothetical protein SAMN04490243_0579 [Robiginitalea myxolifaciens]
MLNFNPTLPYGLRIIAFALLLSGCSIGEEDPGPLLPVLNTTEPSNITQNSVTIGGVFEEEGRIEITDKGIVWAPIGSPVNDGTRESAGEGIADFTLVIDGLEANTTYRARTYRVGFGTIGFGNIVEFTTRE